MPPHPYPELGWVWWFPDMVRLRDVRGADDPSEQGVVIGELGLNTWGVWDSIVDYHGHIVWDDANPGEWQTAMREALDRVRGTVPDGQGTGYYRRNRQQGVKHYRELLHQWGRLPSTPTPSELCLGLHRMGWVLTEEREWGGRYTRWPWAIPPRSPVAKRMGKLSDLWREGWERQNRMVRMDGLDTVLALYAGTAFRF